MIPHLWNRQPHRKRRKLSAKRLVWINMSLVIVIVILLLFSPPLQDVQLAVDLEVTHSKTASELSEHAVTSLRPPNYHQQRPRYPNGFRPNPFTNPARRSSVSNITILPSDPILSPESGWDVSPLVLLSHKLLLFTTPKIGTTVLKQLMRSIMGFPDWPLEDINQPHNPQFNGLQYLYQFPSESVEEFLTSPNWTRAIFVRDPKERLLSAYLDKAMRQNGSYIKHHCCGITKDKSLRQEEQESFRKWQQEHLAKLKRQGKLPPNYDAQRHLSKTASAATTDSTGLYPGAPRNGGNNAPNMARASPYPKLCATMEGERDTVISFESFVKDIVPSCSDPHWASQSERLSPGLWRRINFVGRFDRIAEDTRRLLQQLGLWDTFGATGWPPNALGYIFQHNSVQHKTSASDSLELYYSTPDLAQWVHDFYQADYHHPVLGLGP